MQQYWLCHILKLLQFACLIAEICHHFEQHDETKLLGTSLPSLSLLCAPCMPLGNRISQADAALPAGLLPSLKGKGSIAKGEQLYSLTGTTGSLMYMAPEVTSPTVHSTLHSRSPGKSRITLLCWQIWAAVYASHCIAWRPWCPGLHSECTAASLLCRLKVCMRLYTQYLLVHEAAVQLMQPIYAPCNARHKVEYHLLM